MLEWDMPGIVTPAMKWNRGAVSGYVIALRSGR